MGTLRLITVPIGNLGDITLRALNALKTERFFFAEDTRTFYSLLKHLELERTDLIVDSYHDQSTNKVQKVIKLLGQGHIVNIVSEAGSPVISDPAYPLIVEAISKGHQIETFPGVSSVIAALELSGLPVHPFKFYGFFPRKKSEIIKICDLVKESLGTNLLFESPYRLLDTLKILTENLNDDTEIVVCRELTKKFETIYRFKLSSFDQFKIDYAPKGEIVVCIHNKEICAESKESLELKKLSNTYLEKPTKKNMSKLISQILGKSSKEIYSSLNQS